MKVLLLSPHFDDAAFSAGGTVAMLASRGHDVLLVTVFSAGRHPASGFALACQRDKGFADDVDYMALRREEDARAAGILDVRVRELGLLEAPNRGYHAAQALFGEYVAEDDGAAITAALRHCWAEERPDLVLAPAALGGHVDHRRVLDAALEDGEETPIAFWRDTPYAIRQPSAPLDGRIAALEDAAIPITGTLERKLSACLAYGSQLGFQFGGPDQATQALRDFALREGGGVPAERFRLTPGALRMLRA